MSTANPPDTATTQPDSEGQTSVQASDRAWYLYGITRSSAQDNPGLPVGPRLDRGELVQVLDQGEIAAIVRPVPLAEFEDESIRAHLQDAGWLEARVRDHHQVIEAIHKQHTILPAKFGAVYPHLEELRASLEDAQGALRTQLERLEGCDEWGVRFYADRSAIQRDAAARHPGVQRLTAEITAANPGRAYLLKRKLTDELRAATEQALSDLAQTGYDHLMRHAVLGQASPRSRAPGEAREEEEVLHAAFLVARPQSASFIEALSRFTECHEGLRCEYSGPWPPYSFAMLAEEEP